MDYILIDREERGCAQDKVYLRKIWDKSAGWGGGGGDLGMRRGETSQMSRPVSNHKTTYEEYGTVLAPVLVSQYARQ